MRVAILSDLHLGYERFYDDAYKQAREAFEAIANEGADMVIIPGDIFDKRNPKPDVMAQAINLFRDFSHQPWKAKLDKFIPLRGGKVYTDAPIIAIPGTHERVAEGKENPLTLLGLAGLLIDASEATAIIRKGEERVAVFGLGGLSEERVKSELLALGEKPIDGCFNIFMFHQSIYEILPFSDNFIHFDELPIGYDLYVNGHIHNKIEDKVHGKPFLIPGSTVLTQLKEGEQEPKGFYIFDTIAGTWEFKRILSRPFRFFRIQLADATPKDVIEEAESALEGALKEKGEKPIVKLSFSGTIAKGFKNVDLPLHSIYTKYSDKVMLDIDSSKVSDQDTQESIEEIREGKLEGTNIKDLGMEIFSSKLKESGFRADVNPAELFNILSSNKKEKAIKLATELFSDLEENNEGKSGI
ncbi:metallophosphoesterase [mine drainage metagenome]|uniref:Metallophosphoesterase n=1 Tax=mine drainage metagenome TaxID=410659 RepID=T0Y5F3_9ZZZZ